MRVRLLGRPVKTTIEYPQLFLLGELVHLLTWKRVESKEDTSNEVFHTFPQASCKSTRHASEFLIFSMPTMVKSERGRQRIYTGKRVGYYLWFTSTAAANAGPVLVQQARHILIAPGRGRTQELMYRNGIIVDRFTHCRQSRHLIVLRFFLTACNPC